ncbi:MAG: hypothetical protein HWE21_05750 [Cytophagia bacterium]|nr:hypothetical protein [Cytophagia bacterium]
MFQEFRLFKGVLNGLFKTKGSGKESASSVITSVRYLNGHEVLDPDPERFRRALLTQGISKDQLKYGKYLQWTNELKIAGNRVVELIEHSYDREPVSQVVNVELPILDWADHKYFFLVPASEGPHQVGGNCSKEIEFNSPYGFSFIAAIDGKDPLFDWVKADQLNIFYPLNTCCLGGLFIDWADESNPIVLNPEVMTNDWNSGDNDGAAQATFNDIKYKSTTEIDVQLLEDEFGDTHICGVPLWYQAPDIPICPKTGEVMKYVTTIRSNAKNQLVEGKSMFGDFLTFMDMGFLYVFWEPTSKVMYLTVQC